MIIKYVSQYDVLQNTNMVHRTKFALKVALITVILIVAIVLYPGFVIAAHNRDGFVSQRAVDVTRQSKNVFASRGRDVKYRDYEKEVEGADPVLFHRVKTLSTQGSLNPENVEQIL